LAIFKCRTEKMDPQREKNRKRRRSLGYVLLGLNRSIPPAFLCLKSIKTPFIHRRFPSDPEDRKLSHGLIERKPGILIGSCGFEGGGKVAADVLSRWELWLHSCEVSELFDVEDCSQALIAGSRASRRARPRSQSSRPPGPLVLE
jgi:hypothetical protein